VSPKAWEVLSLGPHTFPGYAQVKIKRSRKLDEKEGDDTAGGTVTPKGAKCAEVEIVVRIGIEELIDDELEALETILASIDIVPGVGSEPYDIVHPMASIRRVRSITISDIEGPDPVGDFGGEWELKIKGKEFRPPVKQAARTPKKSKEYKTYGEVKTGTKGPTAAQQAEIMQQVAEQGGSVPTVTTPDP
jgi:hypothetical protein